MYNSPAASGQYSIGFFEFKWLSNSWGVGNPNCILAKSESKSNFAISVITSSLLYLNINPILRIADDTIDVFISGAPSSEIMEDNAKRSSFFSL